jgi:hypothetical protein
MLFLGIILYLINVKEGNLKGYSCITYRDQFKHLKNKIEKVYSVHSQARLIYKLSKVFMFLCKLVVNIVRSKLIFKRLDNSS